MRGVAGPARMAAPSWGTGVRSAGDGESTPVLGWARWVGVTARAIPTSVWRWSADHPRRWFAVALVLLTGVVVAARRDAAPLRGTVTDFPVTGDRPTPPRGVDGGLQPVGRGADGHPGGAMTRHARTTTSGSDADTAGTSDGRTAPGRDLVAVAPSPPTAARPRPVEAQPLPSVTGDSSTGGTSPPLAGAHPPAPPVAHRRSTHLAGAGIALVALLLVGALVAVATRAEGDADAPDPQAAVEPGLADAPPEVASAPLPVQQAAPAPAACAPTTVEGLAASVLMVGMPGVVDADDPLVDVLVDLGVGGVLLNRTNVASEEQLQALTAGLTARFGGHLTIALDEEGGRVSPLSALGLGGPSARRLAQRDDEAIELAGQESGAVAAGLGATMLLGPVVDLDGGPAGGIIGDRSFGTEPDAVGEAARRYATGVREAGIASAAKHWPGYAGAPDTHLGAGTAPVNGDELVGRHVAAFLPVLDDGIPAVMVSHVVYPSLGPLPASLNPAAYRLLRQNGYEGPALTDALGMGAIHTRWGFDRSGALAVIAGADVALFNQGGDARLLRDGIVAAVASGVLDESRLRDAARRAATIRPGC